MDFMKLMKNAKNIQGMMEDMQSKMTDIEVEGSSGGDMVKVTLNGKGQFKNLVIEPDLMQTTDASMLADLIMAAHRQAHEKMEAAIAENSQNLAATLGIQS